MAERLPRALAAGLALALALAGCVAVQGGSAPARDASMKALAAGQGYLDPAALDVLQVIAPAPLRGDARDEADRRMFRETRALRDSPRWVMAREDAALDSAHMLEHFACSLDLRLTPAQSPRLLQLLQKASRDAARGVGVAKDTYQRQRPFWIDEGPICVSREELGTSFDYPSGHSAMGWTWGVVLSQVAPSHATALLARGRSIGDSRVFCGAHNASAVESARLAAGAALALVTASAAYREDLDTAREEMQRLQADPALRPDPQACRAEAQLVAMPLSGISGATSPSASPAP
jgi:acid phosphatase (class A)